MGIFRDIIYLSAINNIVNGSNNKQTKMSDNKGSGCSSGCISVFCLFLVIGVIGALFDKCTGKETTQEVRDVSNNEIMIEREYLDTIRNGAGEIIDIKHQTACDIKIILKKDGIHLITPYACYKPAIFFNFNKPVFNKEAKELCAEHIYSFQLQKSTNKTWEYIVKRQLLPNMKDMMSENCKTMDPMLSTALSISFRNSAYITKQDKELFDKHPELICSFEKRGEYNFKTYLSYSDITDDADKIKIWNYLAAIE